MEEVLGGIVDARLVGDGDADIPLVELELKFRVLG
jgi:hypothetical protein